MTSLCLAVVSGVTKASEVGELLVLQSQLFRILMSGNLVHETLADKQQANVCAEPRKGGSSSTPDHHHNTSTAAEVW